MRHISVGPMGRYRLGAPFMIYTPRVPLGSRQHCLVVRNATDSRAAASCALQRGPRARSGDSESSPLLTRTRLRVQQRTRRRRQARQLEKRTGKNVLVNFHPGSGGRCVPPRAANGSYQPTMLG